MKRQSLGSVFFIACWVAIDLHFYEPSPATLKNALPHFLFLLYTTLRQLFSPNQSFISSLSFSLLFPFLFDINGWQSLLLTVL
jgi:hypothetical protein